MPQLGMCQSFHHFCAPQANRHRGRVCFEKAMWTVLISYLSLFLDILGNACQKLLFRDQLSDV